MLKRPLLCGVLAFVIGQIIISRGNMTWGLGMIPIGFVIWCIRKRNQSGIMPFLLWLYLICLLLGGLNGMRCRMLSPLQKYMDACYEENGQEEVLCEMEGRVERAEIQKGKWIFLIRANRIRNERFQYQSPCRVKLYSKEGDIKIGDRITCELTLKRLPIPTNPGEFNSRQYYLARGIEFTGYADTVRVLDEGRYTGKQWLWKLRMQTQKVFQMHMSEEYASVMNAMLLGDSGNLDPEIKQLYQRNGIAHILAISGLHVSILGSMLYRLLRKLGLPYGAAGPPVIGLLLAGLNDRFRRVYRKERMLETLMKLLREYQAVPESDGIASLLEQTEAYRKDWQMKRENGVLSGQEEQIARDVTACLDTYARKLREQMTDSQMDTDTCFLQIRTWFATENEALADLQDAAGEALEHVFDFMESLFGESQELAVFMTELNASSYALSYLTEYDCERYQRYNQSFMFDENRDRLLRRIDHMENWG